MSFLENRIPPPIIGVLTILIIWALSRHGPGPVFDNTALTVFAIILAATGLFIDISSLLSFRKAKTTFNPLKPEKASTLVVSGLFKYSRNPMYLGMIFVISAFALHRGHILGILPIIGFYIYITRFQIIPEERAMLAQFKNYQDYMKNVGRWI